ncbi:hypothetical protein CK218_12845 [Mesorhizobium sp. WSM3879]|nr:hypothetical protein CK218_12845 [Mesorhizobium sp. WSM3879]
MGNEILSGKELQNAVSQVWRWADLEKTRFTSIIQMQEGMISRVRVYSRSAVGLGKVNIWTPMR